MSNKEMLTTKSTLDIADDLSVFLLKYRQHVEYADRQQAVQIIERAVQRLVENDATLKSKDEIIAQKEELVIKEKEQTVALRDQFKGELNTLRLDVEYIIDAVLQTLDIRQYPDLKDCINRTLNRFRDCTEI